MDEADQAALLGDGECREGAGAQEADRLGDEVVGRQGERRLDDIAQIAKCHRRMAERAVALRAPSMLS